VYKVATWGSQPLIEVSVMSKVNKAAIADVKKPSELLYKAGPGSYSPRVEHNLVAWEKVQAAITAGKGKVSHAELCKALKTHFVKEQETHHDFIGYLQNRKVPALVRV
tara:strand:- start:274 stop:597 length:324 start_codon:yes stop_codon:yes gene_type:complete